MKTKTDYWLIAAYAIYGLMGLSVIIALIF